MKTIKIIALIFLCTITAKAQENFKYSLTGIKKVNIYTNTSVKLIVGSSNELIMGKYDDYKDHHNNLDGDHEEGDNDHDNHNKKGDRSKGLTAIYANGKDNTGYGLQIEKEGDVLKIRDLKSFMQRHGFTITLPKDIDVSLNCGSMGGAKIIGFSSDIEIRTSIGQIELVDVTGPITANSSVGSIDVIFVHVNQNAPITIMTSTGDVDVSLPQNTKANLVLKSSMGTVFTNFDLKTPPRKDGMKKVGANRSIVSKLNDGGVNIRLSSNMGNVYLRKKK